MSVITTPAPFGGINTLNASGQIAQNEATSLINWVPGPGYVTTRGPCAIYSSDDPADHVWTIAPHPNGGGLVCTQGSVFEIDNAVALLSGLSGGSFLNIWHGNVFQDRTIICNGVDTPQVWDGSAITALVATGSGLTLTNLWASYTFKGRVYYIERGQRFFWYPAAGAFQGAMSKYDLSTFVNSAGALVTICPMTIDGGSGPDDLIAFVFDSGEVLVYQGDDPASTNSWQQVGRYKIGKPMGRSCWALVGSATILVTQNGPVDLAQTLRIGPSDYSSAVGQGIALNEMRDVNGVPLYTNAELIEDPRQSILWLSIYNESEMTGAGNGIEFVYGMDITSRTWFKTQGIAYDGNTQTATAVGRVGDRFIIAAGGTGRLHTGPGRTSNGTADSITGGGMVYTWTSGHLDLGSPQNKKFSGVQFSINPYGVASPDAANSGTLTFYNEEQAGSETSVTYSRVAEAGWCDINHIGKRPKLTFTMTNFGGYIWYATDYLVKNLSGAR